ncbi:hypothetical protein PGT21_000828 [Puccinia graminis f. sp. tritici]|uniref:Uncharacterized protein n=1 Tax=Puccinia graminis f. sp. tritici TaxID=56615 RepID=A0A5B0LSP3_PUCGR|nr:hypothetical protein PGT21_000828 [Puccinia graminis f. sp. tritici]
MMTWQANCSQPTSNSFTLILRSYTSSSLEKIIEPDWPSEILNFNHSVHAIFAAASPYLDDPRYFIPPIPMASILVNLLAPSLLTLLNFSEQVCKFVYHAPDFSFPWMLGFLSLTNPTYHYHLDHRPTNNSSQLSPLRAHLEESARWNTSFLNNQLRKRAFFALITVEKNTTSSLGYVNVPQSFCNRTPPIFVEDATMSLLDKQDGMQPTPEARKQFREQLYSRPQTPGEAGVQFSVVGQK